MFRFEALELGLEIVRLLRGVLPRIRRQDRKLEDQIRRAATSVPLNLAEGNRRVGKDRLHHFRIAAGSADEVLTALRTAEAWGYVDSRNTRRALELVDRLLAVVWRLTH